MPDWDDCPDERRRTVENGGENSGKSNSNELEREHTEVRNPHC